ncbi:MAG TPA: hypothetical protein VHT21_09515, partial [Stellaceae bacterium]|nr:hypothetical protein [Stellaceae bacterium]
MGKREQQLASPFAQFADFLAELLCNLYHLLADVGFARFAQFIFVVSLNDYCRANSDQDQYNQTNCQTDVRYAQPSRSPFNRYRLAERWACSMRDHFALSPKPRAPLGIGVVAPDIA